MGRKPLGPWVVAGVDGSADALAAVELAAAEAAMRGLRLRVVGSMVGSALAGTAEANRAVAEAADRAHLARPNLTVRTLVSATDPAGTLISASRAAGLIVLGARGRGGGPRPGSTCAQVAAYALCPTFVVSSDVDGSARNAGDGSARNAGDGSARNAGDASARSAPVLVGVAEDGHDDAAVGFAFEEAAARGVPLRAAHVWSGPYQPRTSWAAADRRLAEVLARWVEKYPQVPVERLPLYDAVPARALLLASARAGLVVLGTNTPTRYSGEPVGTITRVLIERAGCPVCVVSRPAG
jgi:nucleotide-binding universal stress UspA family protein